MKLVCQVEIIKKLGDGSMISSRKKSTYSCLGISKNSTKKDDFYIFLLTRQSNQEIKYKIHDNIENVFTKFINQGKATIRFKEPASDLHINCKNIIELKSFLHILKMGLDKKLTGNIASSMKSVNFKSSNLIPKKKVIIKQKCDYPVLEGFPRTTEELVISGLDRKSFDRQILRLQSLRILNLSNNLIETLPTELGVLLPHLAELNLSNNCLGKSSKPKKWSWLDGVNLIKSLRLLDLSSNQIKVLPNQIGKLQKLLTLNIGGNLLNQLPSSIGNLAQLKFLDFSNNNISLLPATMRNLRLDCLNIIGNFSTDQQNITTPNCSLAESNGTPTLKEFAGRSVVNNRFFYDATTIPFTLIGYLDNAQFCLCGKSCLEMFTHKVIMADIRCIASSITSTTMKTLTVPFFCIYCSTSCSNKFGRTGIQ